MLSESFRTYPPSLDRIFISASETSDIQGFVEQYFETRNLRDSTQIQQSVVAALRRYPGEAPVRMYELNAWLDKTFRRHFFCRC
ncbi:hypothetical protein DVB73_21760 [Pseudomonas plecoglossicida]|uniref:Uncharacterized protein n=1 Tax=Pseudomonas plecoglossicida TaxID=70775 RepID=A0AAD0R138_PSEDL|nr:hypothetical protein DVB73_21760 [Pseudomonas plecoglossicida]EPB97603.1 hypothetical protein L321_02026 [Pseudomonas plecoglossicida NB2011]